VAISRRIPLVPVAILLFLAPVVPAAEAAPPPGLTLPAVAVPRRGALTPICLRAGAGTQQATVCGLVPGPTGRLSLPFCPAWLWPNAGGTGYYLSALAPGEAGRLWPSLTGPERLTLATDVQ